MTASLVVGVLLGSLCGEASAASFTQVASFGSYGPWGACVWNGRIYVGFYVGHTDLPLYRSGVNNDSFSFVRNLGRGEALPRLWVSPDGNWLNAATEGLSGSETSPGVHWWTNDSADAQNWSSETFGTASTTRGILAAGVYDGQEYQCTYSPYGPGKLFRNSGGWSQYGPNITPTENECILEIQYFNGQLYLGGGQSETWSQPNCGRIVRYSGSSWQQVFNQTAGLIASSAVFDGKLWMGSGSGTSKVYSTSNGTSWSQEYNFGLNGSWTSVEDMIVYNNKLWVAACNGDNSLKILSRAAGGSFVSEYTSSAYKSIGQFVVRGNDLYILVEKVGGGTAALKYSLDSDGDGVGDASDACANTIPGVTVDSSGCPLLVPGDFGRDGDVDQADLDHFLACLTGPALGPPAEDCQDADLDSDDDVDQSDFGVVQRCLSGQDVPGNPGCGSG